MSQIWQLLSPIVEIVSWSSMLSWSSGSSECRDCTEFLFTDTHENHAKVKQVLVCGELMRRRRFVCRECDLVIQPDRDLFFMLDNVFCSDLCRMSFAKADSKGVMPSK